MAVSPKEVKVSWDNEIGEYIRVIDSVLLDANKVRSVYSEATGLFKIYFGTNLTMPEPVINGIRQAYYDAGWGSVAITSTNDRNDLDWTITLSKVCPDKRDQRDY